MLSVDYGPVGVGVQHKYASSTMSSDTLSESCGSRNNRIRTVRLVRPAHGPLPGLSFRHGPFLGFSIRGGREHGTGIFVSQVESGSEAHAQGLRIGDQIIRVNGFAVDDAVHKEVLQLISNHTHLTLKVRGVGMIPVKDKKTDGLSWQIITDADSPIRESPQLGDKLNDVRVNILVAPKSKLGCGICKGPDWKPGIFVQFTKEGGIARDAGLRPGDQILYCNNVDFFDIPFNEAVALMKSSRQLNLVIRKAAGSELFPGESSGYNSSASSVTGDQSPSWSDSKRLSIVKEENLDLGERLNNLDKFKHLVNVKKWDSWDDEPEDKPLFKPTIINLTESGTTIHNNGAEESIVEEFNTSSSSSLSGHNFVDLGQAKGGENIYATTKKERVVVEVHQSDPKSKPPLMKSASNSSFSSFASNATSCSLSSAITLEIQRRQQKIANEKPSIDEQLQKKKIFKGVDSDKQFQHSKLMDEFKRAHKKMFKSSEAVDVEKLSNSVTDLSEDRLNNNAKTKELTERLAELQNSVTEETKRLTISKANSAVSAPPPPPPPPQCSSVTSSVSSTPSSSAPSTRSNTLKSTKVKPKAPPVPVKYSVLSYTSQNGFKKATNGFASSPGNGNEPPPCPSPDYDTLSLASSTSSSVATRKASTGDKESAEMESLESFRINNPANVKPRPPSTYFHKRILSNTLSNQSSSSVSTIRRNRPVSITIGEYPSMRRQPGKLDFLQASQDTVDVGGNDESLGNRLSSELAQTLKRSNLKLRTESMENLLDNSSHKPSQIKTQKNGAVRISLNNLSKAFAKSTSDLTEDFDDHYDTLPLRNRVTINVHLMKPNETPNGILKNGNPDCALSSGHKIVTPQKSITFGEMPTLIKDKSAGKS
ncbi:harmonin isoform X1 [Dendroctonus ponderosae]|uniref:harmonin isoform X1 n=1 Tax=Dendroctonus ponderosae TaxID=77166 RepID=UPI002035243C|nr:harmonin isoform X1 [Dendroctonus ponderosae]